MKLMRAVGAFDSISIEDAAEVTSSTFPRDHPGLLVVSQSGETKDTHRTLQLAERLSNEKGDIPMFSVVNVVGSLIARTTGCGVYLNAGRENAVASTKAFVTQVTA